MHSHLPRSSPTDTAYATVVEATVVDADSIVSGIATRADSTQVLHPSPFTLHPSPSPFTFIEGVRGLLCRGLGTRLIANALQSMLFAVIWKFVEVEVMGPR